MRAGAVLPGTLTVTFLGHASFLIETPGGARAVTDYNGYNAPADPPDIVTMNHAHSTHYTDRPDPRIRYVLRGWRDDGRPADVDLTWRDLHVANLPTNIRDWQGGTEVYGNSIFLFESGGLCIAHLSHLHHLLTEQDLVLLGHIDAVMAPVDGVYTMSQPDVAAVLDQIHPRLVLPMHYFTRDVVGAVHRSRARPLRGANQRFAHAAAVTREYAGSADHRGIAGWILISGTVTIRLQKKNFDLLIQVKVRRHIRHRMARNSDRIARSVP